MTDPNNAQPPRHGVIKRTIGGSLARSWPPPLCRTAAAPAHCCYCYWACLLLLGIIVYAVVRLSFTLCVHTARLVRSRTLTRSHQSAESLNGRQEARSLVAGRPRCHAAAAAACCCYHCCWACLLLLPIIVVLFLLLLCASSRTYVASSRELGERHASCDTTLSVATTAADASACTYSRCCCCCLFCGCCECFNVLPPPLCCCCCCLLSFLKVGLPEAANNHYEIKWVSR